MPIDPDVQAALDTLHAQADQNTVRIGTQKTAIENLRARVGALEQTHADDVAALEMAMADTAATTQNRFASMRDSIEVIRKHIHRLHPPKVEPPRRPKRTRVTRHKSQ